jgi:hypothetical protein
VTISATSQADSSKSASAKLTVSPLALIAVGIATPTGATAGVTGVQVGRGSSPTLFLVGPGLVSGTTYQVTGPNPNDITVTQPASADFCSTTDNLPCVDVKISVNPNAAVGPRNILVTNSHGELTVFPGGILIQ